MRLSFRPGGSARASVLQKKEQRLLKVEIIILYDLTKWKAKCFSSRPANIALSKEGFLFSLLWEPFPAGIVPAASTRE
jgi:hypothetical protein